MGTKHIYTALKELSDKLIVLYKELPEDRKHNYELIMDICKYSKWGLFTVSNPTMGNLASFFTSKINIARMIPEESELGDHIKAIIEVLNSDDINTNSHVEKQIAKAFIDFLKQVNNQEAITEFLTIAGRFWPNINNVVTEFLFEELSKKITADELNIITTSIDLFVPLCDVIDDREFKEKINKLDSLINNLLNNELENQKTYDSAQSTKKHKFLIELKSSIVRNILSSSDFPAAEKKEVLMLIKYFFEKNAAEDKSLDKNMFYIENSIEPKPIVTKLVSKLLTTSIPAASKFIQEGTDSSVILEKLEQSLDKLNNDPSNFSNYVKSELANISYNNVPAALKQATKNIIEIQEKIEQAEIKAKVNTEKNAEMLGKIKQQVSATKVVINNVIILDGNLYSERNNGNDCADQLKQQYENIINSISSLNSKDSIDSSYCVEIENILANIKSTIDFINENSERRLFIKKPVLAYGSYAKGGARLSTIDTEFRLTANLGLLESHFAGLLVSANNYLDNYAPVEEYSTEDLKAKAIALINNYKNESSSKLSQGGARCASSESNMNSFIKYIINVIINTGKKIIGLFKSSKSKPLKNKKHDLKQAAVLPNSSADILDLTTEQYHIASPVVPLLRASDAVVSTNRNSRIIRL